MGTRGYTVLGWVVWQVASRIARRKISQAVEENQTKLIAGGAVALLVLAGVVAAKAGGGDDDY
jgi:hypothetical protein